MSLHAMPVMLGVLARLRHLGSTALRSRVTTKAGWHWMVGRLARWVKTSEIGFVAGGSWVEFTEGRPARAWGRRIASGAPNGDNQARGPSPTRTECSYSALLADMMAARTCAGPLETS